MYPDDKISISFDLILVDNILPQRGEYILLPVSKVLTHKYAKFNKLHSPSGKDANSMLSVIVIARFGFDLYNSETVEGCRCCPSAMMV